MRDRAHGADKPSHSVGHQYTRDIRDRNRAGFDDGSVFKKAVNAKAISQVRRHRTRDRIRRIAINAVVHPSDLARHIVRQLALIENGLAALAVPHYLVLLVVLNHQAQCGNVISVHNQAVIGNVARPTDSCPMIGAPRPDIVEDNVVAIDLDAGSSFACGRSPHAEEHIVEGRGIGLLSKLKAYRLQQEEGLDTVEANQRLGLGVDLRHYGIGAQILYDLGIRQLRLLTNNPKKVVGLEGYGLQMVEQVPIRTESNPHNARYLETKRTKMGHLL